MEIIQVKPLHSCPRKHIRHNLARRIPVPPLFQIPSIKAPVHKPVRHTPVRSLKAEDVAHVLMVETPNAKSLGICAHLAKAQRQAQRRALSVLLFEK